MNNGHHRRDLALQRGLPTNLDAERLVLGSILLDDAAFDAAAGGLCPDDFSLEKHRRIFQRMAELRGRGERIDRVTVAEELRRHSQLESCDGLTYICSLDDGMPKLPKFDSYVGILKEKAILRRTIFTTQQVMNRCFLQEGSSQEILAEAGDLLSRLAEEAASGAQAAIRSVADLPSVRDRSFDSVRYLIEPELPEGAVVALTGDSESGKSSLATAWARELSARGRQALVLDRDNPLQVIRDRFDRLHIVENTIHVWGGWLSEEAPQPDSPRVIDFMRICEPKPIVIVDSLSAFHGGDENDAGEMRVFMNRLRKLTNLGATVVVIHHEGKSDSSKDYRGSSDFKAAVDAAFHVSNIGPNRRLDRLHLRCFKSRFGFNGGIIYRYADGLFRRDEETHAVSRAVTAQLTELLGTHPGVTQNKFEKLAVAVGGSRDQARMFLHTGIEFGQIRTETGSRNGRRHYLKNDCAEPPVENL